MKKSLAKWNSPYLFSLPLLALAIFLSCSGDRSFNGSSVTTTQNYSGYIIVAASGASAAATSTIALFNPSGEFVRVLGDYFASNETVTGLAYLNSQEILAVVDGSDRIERINLTTAARSTFHISVGMTGVLGNAVINPSDSTLWVVKNITASVEKIDSGGSRSGNPFITTTVGSCTLATPFGITFIPSSSYIAVISKVAAGKLDIYDSSGNCISQVTAAPFATGTPTSIVYQASTDKLITTFSTGNNIIATTTTGASPSTIFTNSSQISSPRAIAVDSSGYLYVGSDGTDTIEKLYYPGTGSASRVLSGPLISNNVFTQNPNAILVMP